MLALAASVHGDVTITGADVVLDGPRERLLVDPPEAPAQNYTYTAAASYTTDGEPGVESGEGPTVEQYA